MTVTGQVDALARGHSALASGDWAAARSAFAGALAVEAFPEALDGLGRALWWLREERGAVVTASERTPDFDATASSPALRGSRSGSRASTRSRSETTPAASGWLARAERLLRDVAPGAEQGWLALARSEQRARRRRVCAPGSASARVALDRGRRRPRAARARPARPRRGRARRRRRGPRSPRRGDGGRDERRACNLETFADVCCTLMLACERAGDARAAAAVERRSSRSSCGATTTSRCSRSAARAAPTSSPRTAGSTPPRTELVAAMRELTAAGQRSRCVPPAARLAEIRVLQGRFDEAEQLLDGFEDDPEAIQARRRDAARSRRAAAAAGAPDATARRARVDNLLAAPLLAQLVQARIADGPTSTRAIAAAAALDRIAGSSGRERVEAPQSLARGPRRAAPRDARTPSTSCSEARQRLRRARAAAGSRAGPPRARTRSGPSQSPAVADRHRTARSQRARGAGRVARGRCRGGAHALTRREGPGRAAEPRSSLSRSETEVLRLLGEGLSNREIAERLFISPKTAEHHVGRIYGKLGLSTRAEAAAYAVRTPRAANRGVPPTVAARRQRSCRADDERSDKCPSRTKSRPQVLRTRSSTAETSTPSATTSPTSVWSRASAAAASVLHGLPRSARRARRADRRRRPRVSALDDDRHARRRVQGHPGHRSPRRAECGGGLPHRRRQFAGYWCMTNVAGLMRQFTEEPRSSSADRRLRRGKEKQMPKASKATASETLSSRATRATSRTSALHRRLRAVHGRRRPGAALRRSPRRPLPVPPHGYVLKGRSSSRSPTAGRRCTRPATPTTRRRAHADALRRHGDCRVQPDGRAPADVGGRREEPRRRMRIRGRADEARPSSSSARADVRALGGVLEGRAELAAGVGVLDRLSVCENAVPRALSDDEIFVIALGSSVMFELRSRCPRSPPTRPRAWSRGCRGRP